MELANTIWADGPTLSPSQPAKPKIRKWGTWLESLVAAGSLGDHWYATKSAAASAAASLSDGVIVTVYGDATPSQNGVYRVSSHALVQIANFLPGWQLIYASDAGTSTANALIMSAQPFVPSTDGAVLVYGFIPVTNTSGSVSVTFDGGLTVYAVKTASGNNPPVGGLVAGMPFIGMISGGGTIFRLISDITSSAIQAAAEAARAGAEAAEALAAGYAAGLNLPGIASGDKGKVLVVKTDESGYQLMSLDQRLAKTGSYTIADADHLCNIGLGGSAFYAVTLNAAAGYRSNFSVTISNEDTTRGKQIAIDGHDTFVLWPLQSVKINRSGSVWTVRGKAQRFKLGTVGSITNFYVDPANGTAGVNNTDGLASSGAGAFKYVQDAINNIIKNIDCNNILATITVISDISGEQIQSAFAGQPIGSCQIKIVGNPTGTPIRWVATANSQTFVLVRDNGILTLDGFDFDAGSYTGCIFLYASQNGTLDYSNCWFGACIDGVHIKDDMGGAVNWVGAPGSNNYKVYGMATSGHSCFHWDMYGPSHISMGGATINLPNGLTFSSFLRATGPLFANFGFNAFSGAGAGAGSVGQQYSITRNAIFSAGGSTLPGNSAGATATGGQAY